MMKSLSLSLRLGLPLAVALLATGCVTEPVEAGTARRGRASRRAAAERGLPEEVERDRVLTEYREGLTALREGRDGAAKAHLEGAIARIGGIITNDAEAERARGLFAPESTKAFIGEPYERVMAYYYRGILYWKDGEPDNARACFRSGQVIDSAGGEEKYDADYVLLDHLEGLASMKLGGSGADALARVQARAGDRPVPPAANADANVLIFAEYGRGPRKYAAGQYGEELRFRVEDSSARAARLVLDEGRRIVPLPAYDDLCHQATTRGGRVMDHILGNKAVFKAGTDVASDVALAGAVIAHDQARRRERRGRDADDAEATALGLGILGVIGKIVSAATRPEADTRQWDTLPQRLSFAAINLPPGRHAGRIEFLDSSGEPLAARTRDVIIAVESADRDTVVFLSEHKR